MSALFVRYGKLVALIAGFVFSAIGALWALLVTDRLDAEIQQIADTRAQITRTAG